MSKNKVDDFFTNFTTTISAWLGRPFIFISALAVLILWGISGPVLGFSDTWQLIINTSTTIITFLMVFIIQNTQNRDNLAINIKLDALMNKLDISDDELIEAEDASDEKLETRVKKVQKNAERTSTTRTKRRKR